MILVFNIENNDLMAITLLFFMMRIGDIIKNGIFQCCIFGLEYKKYHL